MDSKPSIRGKALFKRNEINYGDVKILSNEISKKLISSKQFIEANNIMFYISVGNEVNLDFVINKAFEEGKNVILPKVDRFNDTLQLYVVSNIEQDLEIGYGKIFEPKTNLPKFNKHNLDLVLIPGVAFDITGNRVGYGKGHFDKFLENLQILKIAPAYNFQVVSSIPAEKHDVKMDYIVTENRVIKCRY